jgi:hypothetical protein
MVIETKSAESDLIEIERGYSPEGLVWSRRSVVVAFVQVAPSFATGGDGTPAVVDVRTSHHVGLLGQVE